MNKQSRIAKNDGPMAPVCMGLIIERYGEVWCCAGDVDADGDLESQGCWPMDEVYPGERTR